MPDLKPCPKCKGNPKLRRVGDMKQYWGFFCSSCGYTPVKNCEARYTVWGAKRAWNRRAGEEEKNDSINTEIYITGESLVVDIIYHSYGTADIKFRLRFGRDLKEGAD